MELWKSVQRFKITKAATFLWFLRTWNMKIQFSIFWPWLLHERGVSVLFHLTTVLENVNFSCLCFYFLFFIRFHLSFYERKIKKKLKLCECFTQTIFYGIWKSFKLRWFLFSLLFFTLVDGVLFILQICVI